MPSTTTAGRRLTAVLGTLGVLAALGAYLLGTASPAAAHAALTGSSPASGAVVDSAPAEVTLTFSEGVQLSDDALRVLDPSGERADTGELRDRGDGSTVRYGTPLRDGLPDGTYTVAWQAVSADSHPISGAFTFSIGAPSETSVGLPQQEAGGGLVGLLYDAARYAAYAGFTLLVGGAAFVLTCWPRGAGARAVQRVVTVGWVGLAAATLAMLLLRTPYTGSGELADAFDLAGLGDVVGTKTGTALVSRLLLLAAAALFVAVLFGTYARETHAPDDDGTDPVRTDPARRRDLVTGLALGGTAVATGLAVTWAAAGHASTGIQTAVAMPVDVVHLLAVALWLGGLAALAAALYSAGDASGTGTVPREAVLRFSRIALGAVTVLAATGLYQSWRQVGSWSALTGTDYGRLLLLKIALVAALVATGWFSRRWTKNLSRSTADDGPAAQAGSRGSDPDPAPQSPNRLAFQARPAFEDENGKGRGRGEEPPPQPRRRDVLAQQRDATESVESRPATDRSDVAEPAAGDPVRTAQLARQRKAVETAQRRRRRDADPQRTGLRRSVLAESCVAVAVLAVTTLLTETEPARTAEAAEAATGPAATAPASPRELTVPFDTGGPQGAGTAEVTLDPGRTGRNSLDVRLTGPAGKPLEVPELKVSFTLPAKDIGPLRVTPRNAGPGHWTKNGLQLPVPGDWKMELTVRTSDIDQVSETRTVRIG